MFQVQISIFSLNVFIHQIKEILSIESKEQASFYNWKDNNTITNITQGPYSILTIHSEIHWTRHHIHHSTRNTLNPGTIFIYSSRNTLYPGTIFINSFKNKLDPGAIFIYSSRNTLYPGTIFINSFKNTLDPALGPYSSIHSEIH